MGKILRINTKEKTWEFQELPEYFVGLGGRALTSKMVLDEVPAGCHPLGRYNKLIFSPGILSGTPAANSGRLTVGAKSPLTNGIEESNSGGEIPRKLAKLGIAALVLEDKPQNAGFCMVVINKQGVEILDAAEYEGLGNYDLMEKLWAVYGKRTGVMTIGQTGEQCFKAADIYQADPKGKPGLAMGRGGLGAVMGSKKIKAIVVDDTGCDRVPLVDPEGFKAANKKWMKMLKEHPDNDPRPINGVDVTYATAHMGEDQTAGYGGTDDILGRGGSVDPLKNDTQEELSKDLQIATAAIDAAGLCLFGPFAVLDNEQGVPLIVDMINAKYGLSFTCDDVIRLGISILENENAFNLKAGFSKTDEQLPEIFKETFPSRDTQWTFSVEAFQEAKNYYNE